jgi:transposase InsO family protein
LLAGSQHTSIAFTDRLIAAGVGASVGSVGDAYDNALAESTIGLYKTELVRNLGPWRDCDHVEIATLEYVDWSTTADHAAAPRTYHQPSSRPSTLTTAPV